MITADFYSNQEEPNKSCFYALREIILRTAPGITETIKYGMPYFVTGRRILFYLWKDKKTDEPYILFADGNKLDHPHLESGDRAKMKILRIDPKEDLDLDLIRQLLTSAVNAT